MDLYLPIETEDNVILGLRNVWNKTERKIQYSRIIRKEEEEELNCSFLESNSARNSEIQDLKDCVGMVRAEWKDRQGRVVQVKCSTGFAISSRIIVTCAHGVVDSHSQKTCDLAYFIPVNGKVQSSCFYKTQSMNFLQIPTSNVPLIYDLKPLREDFAVLILDRSLGLQRYLRLASQPSEVGDQLAIIGYSGTLCRLELPQKGEEFVRVFLEGKHYRSQGDSQGQYVLVHTMPTVKGLSGSPILLVEGDNDRVVGIHTHKGYDHNEGLLMTRILSQQILSYAEQLCRWHKVPLNELKDVRLQAKYSQ